MGSFLLREKNGVFWRGLKGSAIFALGFYTYESLSPYSKATIKEAKALLAEVKSAAEERRARLAKSREIEKEADKLIQTLMAQIAKLEIAKLKELKKAERRYAVGTCCESQEESVWSFV